MSSIEDRLRQWLKDVDRVVVVGVGNELRGDDFVGMAVVKSLKGRVDERRVLLIESETVPESFLEEIVKFHPSHVLVADAGLVELEAGGARFVDANRLFQHGAVSTHILPLRIFCEYLKKTTRAKIALLIVQPRNTDFGEGMSREVERAVKMLARIIKEALP
ncbi:MAG: hydrogenase maturation protease [Candidatus Bathyarchaeia archaeon]